MTLLPDTHHKVGCDREHSQEDNQEEVAEDFKENRMGHLLLHLFLPLTEADQDKQGDEKSKEEE